MPSRLKKSEGFTLTELLIALAILGVIATFIIPKVLQAQQEKHRLSAAQETLGTLSGIARDYAMANSGCFSGNITCNFNPSTGAVLDGKPASSSPTTNPGPYNAFTAYLDSKLNYISKATDGSGYAYYYLASGVIVSPGPLIVTAHASGRVDLGAIYNIYMDRTPAQVLAGTYSYFGVDTHGTHIFTFRNGRVYGGFNNYRINVGLSYSPGFASIYDLETHPQDTCVVVGGTNCGIN